MSAHAKFSPSSLKRVAACPASYAHAATLALVDLGIPESSAASREGTTAHALGELCLKHGVSPKLLVGKELSVELDGKIERPVITKEMADSVAIYVEHCNMLAMLADQKLIEQKVQVTTCVHRVISRDLLWGTADFIAMSSDRIDVVDLKFGGMSVEPENNPQLICYLLGALELVDEAKRPNKAGVHIVQPKLSSEPKIWEIEDVAALRAEWLPRFEAAMERAIEAAAIEAPLPEHHEAGEHCHFCPALVGCEHFATMMIDITAAELEEIEPPATAATEAAPAAPPLDPERYARLVKRWKAKSTIKRYFELLEARLMADLRKGVDVPELKIVQSNGHRKWALDEADMVSRLRNQGLKKKDFMVQKLASPAAIEKLIDNDKFFKTYVVRPVSEKLVLDTDKRPAVDHASILEVIEPVEAPVDLEQFDLDLGMWPESLAEETQETEETEDEIQL